ncbi:ExbD/TolR family protein [Aliikangiella coralliicola]|uniref:Biopolymer transporter ExbD n=1 Tax=Aliikangiella coralliicola TaxID=2592383 RepID=A0A545U4Z3_9GAMM|nr:biopolymer transporter ExbD [Aliikangiella coralliicola]TQV84537.1 biopolymer transporter ExbD [Aliikangiella coralliicola]
MKKSYRAVRMERHHKRFGSGGLNLVSLMDIFTILVFFLLVNSSTVQQLPSSKAVKLPESTAQQLPEETVIVLVNNEQILVQGRVIATVANVLKNEDAIIPELLAEMKFQSQNSWQPETANEEEEGLDVTVMGDKKIPYKLLRKILSTLSQANYTNISMAVMKRSESKSAGR